MIRKSRPITPSDISISTDRCECTKSLISQRNQNRRLIGCLLILSAFLSAGCHDGPLYGLKHVNPYFAMREWKHDRALGVTDHERRNELEKLASQIGDMNSKDQRFWTGHLGRIIKNDPSPEMRRLAVLAASDLKTTAGMDLIREGLDDESTKVQMEACRSLGNRREPEAAQLLASTLGKTTEQDVKNSAIAALGNHKGNVSMDSLRIVLDEQDPATIDLAMSSLRGVMGRDLGSDPKVWIAAIDKTSAPSEPGLDSDEDPAIRFAEKEGSTFR